MKTYYFPNHEHVIDFYGSKSPVCVDYSELERLARGWDMNIDELTEQVHEASDAEILEHGTYDSEKTTIICKIRKTINNKPARSAWEKGVKIYALELLENLEEGTEGGYIDPTDLENPELLKNAMLNGASDWAQYSWGGCSLIYDGQIAKRLCTPSEYKRKRDGDLQPNGRENWLDVQARALYQAAHWIINAARA